MHVYLVNRSMIKFYKGISILCSPTGPNLLNKWMRNPLSFQVVSANLPSVARTPASPTRVVIKLLTQFNSHPLPAHIAVAWYVLQYLQQSRTRGISYSSTSSNISGSISYPCTNPAATGYTDANWGPQDASTPSPTDTVTINEWWSLHGAIITSMGGAISW